MYECCQCTGIEKIFNAKTARREIRRYEKHGPRKTTQWLIDRVAKHLSEKDLTLIDIGGGIGAIQYGLIKHGINQVNSIDASSAYHDLAAKMAQKLGAEKKIQRTHGDFTDESIQPASVDVVTLDRVICCYPNMHELVSKSAGLANHVYAVVFPRERKIVGLGVPILNFLLKLRRIPFRVFMHSTSAVDRLVQEKGFTFADPILPAFWQVRVYTTGQNAEGFFEA